MVQARSAAQHQDAGLSHCLDRLTTVGCYLVSHTALGQCCGAGGIATGGHTLIASSAFGNLCLPSLEKMEL